jgi:hypothetical protein
MHDYLQPYLSDVVNAVVGLFFAALVAVIVNARQNIVQFITTHTSSSQRAFLGVISGEAVAYAGTVFKEQNGEQRLQEAIDYVNKHLPKGFSFTEAELRGAVEKAYAAYKDQTAPSETNTTVSVQGQTDGQKVADVITTTLNAPSNPQAPNTQSNL